MGLRLIPKEYNMKKSNKAVASLIDTRREVILNTYGSCWA